MATRRRDLLIIAGAAVVALAIPPAIRRFRLDFEFQPIPGLPGFRSVASGTASAVPVALIGIGAEQASDREQALRDETRADPCAALFGTAPVPVGKVPVAVFSDYYCTYCPDLSRNVMAMQADGAPIDVHWHEFPIFGPRSEAAARLALAAGEQGAYAAAHERLMRGGLRPGPAARDRFAEELGLDPVQLAKDAQGTAVAGQIDASRALAQVFGITGTPSMVVGRTLIVGNTDPARLRRLVELELADEGWRAACDGA